MKYVVYKGPGHGAAKCEVRTEPGERTMADCSSREEAKRLARTLNAKPAWVSPEDLVERALSKAQPTAVTDPEILNGLPVFDGSGVPIDMHPTREFWQEAAAIAVEYKGVGALIRMWADAEDDAERLAILIDIVELMTSSGLSYEIHR
jgi:hypothetical protein